MHFPIAVIDFDAVMMGNSRPISAGRNWLLYGNECGRMMFGNCHHLPFANDQNQRNERQHVSTADVP